MKLLRSFIVLPKRLNSNLAFVPTYQDPSEEHLEALKDLLHAGDKPNKGKQKFRKLIFKKCYIKFFSQYEGNISI